MVTGRENLTDAKVRNAKPSLKSKTYMGDGHGLHLCIRKTGAKSWVFISSLKGRRREIGLGGYPTISLAQARRAADVVRQQIGDGLDPIAERNKEAPKTFGEVSDLVLQELESGWDNNKTGAQWRRSLNVHCKLIRAVPVNEINTELVLKVIKPVWVATPETGRRLRSRIEHVLSYAHTRGWRTGENPALWKNHLEHVLPAQKRKDGDSGHFAAMPYKDLPAFITELQTKNTHPALALEFTILTAARTGETLGATWQEIDFESRLWTIPAKRMKMKNGHTVPLSDRALQILTALHEVRFSDYIFTGNNPHKPMSNMSMAMVLRRMGIGGDVATVHGMRSSFRDFAGNETRVAREVAEAALAHQIGNKVERAYRRSDALEKRRGLMSLWADYCAGVHSGDVVRLRG